MKYKIKQIIPVALLLLAVGFNSCYDDKMEWEEKKKDVSLSEIPLQLQEKIALYSSLRTYFDEAVASGRIPANFKLGAGIGLAEYTAANTAEYDLVNANFNDISIGYAMKHGGMMGSDGNLKTDQLDRLFEKLAAAPNPVSLYGHTLVWHSNQNAAYLNALIAPTIIPPVAGGNLLDITGLQDGTFNNWNPANNAGGITIVEGAGIDGGPAIRFEVTSAGNEWDTQLISPDIPTEEGAPLMFSFKIRSEEVGNFRISFQNMSNNYPWYGGGALVATATDWTDINYGADSDLTAAAAAVKMQFDMGKTAGVYYVDINSLKVIDLNAPEEVNYVINGGFEDDLNNWSALNPGAGITVVDTEKYEGTHSLQLIAGGSAANAWDLQLESAEIILEEGKNYTFSFMIKSDKAGKGRVSFPGYTNQYPWMDWQAKGASEAFELAGGDWEYIGVELTGGEGGSTIKLSFDLGYLPDVTYWLDEVKVTPKEDEPSGAPMFRAGPTIIEKTDEEKKEIITAATKKWIFDMMTYCKGKVHAWDVLNEPMKEGGGTSPRDESVVYENDDEFNYPQYMGPEYSAKAFIWAREADPNAVLFINEYNLESNIARCKGYIEYVKAIEAMVINEPEFAGKKAVIDGIGTQMHVGVDTNKDDIREMFELLAATGKKIKISELDVRLGSASPAFTSLVAQMEMYKYIVETYIEVIPVEQQYGITAWGIYDSDADANWLPGESQCLWTIDGKRKPAYVGFCDAIAGRSIGDEDFDGLDWGEAYPNEEESE